MSIKRLPRPYRPYRPLLGLAIAALLLFGSASVAHAQYYGAPPPRGYGGYPPPPPPPPAGVYRGGLVLGAGIGFGGISAADCGSACGIAGALELHIGGMLNPRLAIVGDVWFNAHTIPNSDASAVHTLYVIALQYWANDKFWLKGGVGGANMNITSDFDGFVYGDENGPGFMVAGGLEFLQAYNFVIDGQLRYGHGFYDIDGDVNVWALMIGASWY